jgi:hypothetical protein
MFETPQRSESDEYETLRMACGAYDRFQMVQHV